MREHDSSRRGFLQRLGTAGIGLPLLGILPADDRHRARALAVGGRPSGERPLCVFSKHLQFLDYEPMADAAAAAGFDGVDLTVRPGGHVLPENVERDLPRAVRAVEAAGLAAPMMTTAIARADEPHADAILRTAADLGIRYYRMNWVDYDDDIGIIEHLRAYRPHLERLAALNRNLGLHGAYQNHAGASIGAAVWDLHILLDGLDPAHVGVQYDIRHAVVEGAHSWPLGLKLLHPYIKTTVIKDFTWKEHDGALRIENVPLGEGTVDFAAYYRLIGTYGISGPISLHFEYPMPGETSERTTVDRTRETVAVMKSDLRTLRSRLSEAGL